MRYLVRLVTMPRETVILDPFAGSGTTCLAAALEGVHYLACELSEEHVQIARKRVAERCALPLFEAPAP